MPSSPELSDTAAEDQVETERESPPPPPPDGENGHENGETKESNDESDLSDVEALVMQEAEQEIAVEERIRDAYREAGSLKVAAARQEESSKAVPVQEIVYCEGEEEKVRLAIRRIVDLVLIAPHAYVISKSETLSKDSKIFSQNSG